MGGGVLFGGSGLSGSVGGMFDLFVILDGFVGGDIFKMLGGKGIDMN